MSSIAIRDCSAADAELAQVGKRYVKRHEHEDEGEASGTTAREEAEEGARPMAAPAVRSRLERVVETAGQRTTYWRLLDDTHEVHLHQPTKLGIEAVMAEVDGGRPQALPPALRAWFAGWTEATTVLGQTWLCLLGGRAGGGYVEGGACFDAVDATWHFVEGTSVSYALDHGAASSQFYTCEQVWSAKTPIFACTVFVPNSGHGGDEPDHWMRTCAAIVGVH